MNIQKYTGYFHDGTLIGIKKKENNIEFFLESFRISSDDLVDKKLLSEANTLKGKLCLIGVQSVKVDKQENKEIPWKEYDDGEILDLSIDNNTVFLLIQWKNFPPKLRSEDVGTIEIEFEKAYWENIPDLSDDYFKQGGGQS